jgi:hypothetical protein
MDTSMLKIVLPLAGGVFGALAGGPIGLGIGAALGLGAGLIFGKQAAPTALPAPAGPAPTVGTLTGLSLRPEQVGLPTSANMNAALTATRMLIINQPSMKTPAASWLKQFQTSVGLPGTGKLDPQTRAMLVQATSQGNTPGGVDARKIPAKSLLS